MKILQFKSAHGIRLGTCEADEVVDLAAALAALRPDASTADKDALRSTYELLNAPGGIELAATLTREALAAPQPAYVHAFAGLDLAAPITRPEKIIGIGVNFTDHLEEMGHAFPTTIVNFPMYGNALVGQSDPIVIPRNSEEIDWEAELVFVIGKTARFVSEADAMDHVFGYSVGNDVCVRDAMRGDKQLLRGKTQDGHAPMGPWIVTKDEVGDIDDLGMRLWVNGVQKQNGSTRTMIFKIPRIVSFLSEYMTLRPGDVVFTGTPAGVALAHKPPQWLKPGDRVEIEIDKVGRLTNVCQAEAI